MTRTVHSSLTEVLDANDPGLGTGLGEIEGGTGGVFIDVQSRRRDPRPISSDQNISIRCTTIWRSDEVFSVL